MRQIRLSLYAGGFRWAGEAHLLFFPRPANFPAMPLEIVPSIDLRGGKVVRLKQGDYARQINYAVDPIETARSFAEAGATWMHIVDLDGAKEGRPMQTELVSQVIGKVG